MQHITPWNENGKYALLFSNGIIITTSSTSSTPINNNDGIINMDMIVNYDEEKENNNNINNNNALVSLSSNETWFEVQHIEENKTSVCLSYEGSTMLHAIMIILMRLRKTHERMT